MTTFTEIIHSDNVSDKLAGPSNKGRLNSGENRLFGITMACKHSHEDLHRVYRVDIGSSRSQDQIFFKNEEMVKITNKDEERKQLLSRSPQVLEIIGDNINIVRSNIKNTRTYLHRPRYENFINTVHPEMSLSTYKKYLKYKNKYLQLKKNK
jgi:hypothetical protein